MEKRKYEVLIVDDDKALRDIVAQALSMKGHLCETAPDGPDAIFRTKTKKFDAVITDVVMPGMDGITLTGQLLREHPSIAVMVMTGFGDQKMAEDALDAGAGDFINKPFALEEFSNRFSRMMRDHQIIFEMRQRGRQLEKMGSEIISGIQSDTYKKIKSLTEEIETLKEKISAYSGKY